MQPPIEKAADGKWVVRADKPIREGWFSPVNEGFFSTKEDCEGARKAIVAAFAAPDDGPPPDPESAAFRRSMVEGGRCVPEVDVLPRNPAP